VYFSFSGQLSVLLLCCPALLYFLLHISNCFIEQINDDDDDDDMENTSVKAATAGAVP